MMKKTMRVVQINSYNYGSTGNIMNDIALQAEKAGIENITCCPSARSMRKNIHRNQLFIGTRAGRNLHIVLAKITGLNGCFSVIDTYVFLKKIEKFNPDIIHLHNLHNCYINLPLLFGFTKKKNIKLVWTLHDCWSFTGKCPYFTAVNCYKWQNGCHSCPQLKEYPNTFTDSTKLMWALKKRWFNLPDNIAICTPSAWLAEKAKQSFLKKHTIRVINNGIDLSQFYPRESDFRKRYSCENKKLILGVAFIWEKRKGLDVFVKLAESLADEYKIVLVGTDEATDRIIPDNIISIHRTKDKAELAEIYSAADVFVNPTREEVLGMVNIEALACGTPVITFDTGGSPEIIDSTCGSVVAVDDISALEKEITDVCTNKKFAPAACTARAAQFAKEKKIAEYISLYEALNEF